MNLIPKIYPSNKLKLQRTVVGAAIALSLGSVGAMGVAQAQLAESSGSGSSDSKIQLYGETPQPEQMQKGYVVFSNQNGRVVGAFYSPRSEFTCFTGSQDSKSLDIKPVSPEGIKNPEVKVQLEDLHRIQTVTPNDQQIVSACQQTVAFASK